MNRPSILPIRTGLRSILISAVLFFLLNNSFSQSVSPGSLYLGQTPPENIPKIFPLAVKQGFFAAERIAISHDGRDIYYSELKGYYPNTGKASKSAVTQMENGPAPLPCSKVMLRLPYLLPEIQCMLKPISKHIFL